MLFNVGKVHHLADSLSFWGKISFSFIEEHIGVFDFFLLFHRISHSHATHFHFFFPSESLILNKTCVEGFDGIIIEHYPAIFALLFNKTVIVTYFC
jgi:hypothetical protein